MVARQLRSALDDLGHETFVLARPKKERGPRPGALDRDDVWDQPNVTEASAYDVPRDEYVAWAEANGIEAVLCDQNYQFAELAELRARGVTTIGRFVWEHFTAEHVAGAREAFDVVYSFTRAEQARYAEMGLDTPYVPWGCHPELIEIGDAGRPRHAPAGTRDLRLPRRLPRPPQAARAGARGVHGNRRRPRLRLSSRRRSTASRCAPPPRPPSATHRIELRLADQPTAEHLREVATADVCLAPPRWEGLGLPLYEAVAFGQPAITNDAPPMNEVIHDGRNGLLVELDAKRRPRSPGSRRSTRASPDLRRAIERLADDSLRAELAAGAVAVRDSERRWSDTVAGIGELLTNATNG